MKKQKSYKLIFILFICIIFLINSGCKNPSCPSNSKPPTISNNNPFTSPENTIKYYHKKIAEEDLEAVRSCFWSGDFSENALGKFWDEYKIISKKIYDKNAVEEFKEKIDIVYDEMMHPIINDVEIIVTVKFDRGGGIKENEFLYLLRKKNNKWIIQTYSSLEKYD